VIGARVVNMCLEGELRILLGFGVVELKTPVLLGGEILENVSSLVGGDGN
jgi:hypothetical protein